MKFLAIDLETTGLQPDQDQILQIGAVLFDFVTPENDLPRWETVIAHERITGHPFALAMNAGLIAQIANRQKYPEVNFSKDCRIAYFGLAEFMAEHGFSAKSDGKLHIVVAGKNAAGFEMPFVNAPQNDGQIWRATFQAKHRVFDPGSLYFQHGDAGPPDLKTCLARAGIEKEVAHTGVADALDVVRLLRHKYGMDPAG
jgi:oligoribonuclease